MCRYVVIVAIVVVKLVASVSPPLRVTIDCRSDEDLSQLSHARSTEVFGSSRFDFNSFCNLIHRAIPQSIKDGKFVIESESDQHGYSDTVAPVIVAPPTGFIPKFPKLRPSRLRLPKLDVPKLRPTHTLGSPRIGPPKLFSQSKQIEEESSAERMEKFKKGVQKMLHFVKVLGRIDQYLSERTRIVVDKLSKTFAE